MFNTFLKLLYSAIIFSLLTLLTQVGGIIFLLCKFFFKIMKVKWKFVHKSLIFVCMYLLLTFTLIPFLASKLGRVPLPYFATTDVPLKPLNIGFGLLNRNYVKPELRNLLIETAQQMQKKHPETIICYLDACFPFWNKFPLLPHLSHNDGKKADLAFCYADVATNEAINDSAPAWFGYGIFEDPKKGESNKNMECKQNGHWQYDFTKYVGFSLSKPMKLDAPRTKTLLTLLTNQSKIGMILIEPHLKNRMKLSSAKIRFQGCHSVRHDDHIHIQLY